MSAKKFDHEPLLAPGCHFMTLPEVESRFVDAFAGEPQSARRSLYLKLEEMCQQLLRRGLCCDIYLDGSFLTKKPTPGDLDIIISIDEDHYNSLSEEEMFFLENINLDEYIIGLDAAVYVSYPRESPFRGIWSDAREICAGYGQEHSGEWLKGYGVLRLHETDVGVRIRR